MTNPTHTVLYTGVTSNLEMRAYEHKHKLTEGFTKRYNCTKLVYYQQFENITLAIQEEKRLKGGSRKQKEDMIHSVNPDWQDLYEKL